MMQKKFLLGCILLLCCGCLWAQKGKKPKYQYLDHSKTPDEIRKMDNKLEKVYYSFVGEFNNLEQAARTDNPVLKTPQAFICVPIWRERTGEYWFYLGWFMQSKPEKALAHSISRISKLNRDTFKMTTYAVPHEAEHNHYAYEWQKEKPFSHLKPKDLELDKDNLHYIVVRSEHEFELLANDEPTPGRLGDNIHYYRRSTQLSPEIFRAFAEFYDQDKKMIFSYPLPEGLEMKRVDKSKPSYPMVSPKKKKK